MTEQQERQQCDGPGQPSIFQLVEMLLEMPSHHKVRAVSINGQASVVVIETYHEGLEQHHLFTTNEFENA